MSSTHQAATALGSFTRVAGSATILALLAMAVGGCAKHEKVLEINTPGGSVEVEKTTHMNGDVDLKVQKDQ